MIAIRLCTSDMGSDSTCHYPGNVHTFECTVENGIATVWKVVHKSCNKEDITLLHSRFHNNSNVTTDRHECDGNVNVFGESIGNETDNATDYTSRLHITLASSCGFIGTTVECSVDNGSSAILQETFTIPGNN